MPELKPGARCQTKGGKGTCLALTPMQARVHLDEVEDPRWFPRSAVEAIEADVEEEAPTIQQLLGAIETLVQEVRTRLALEQPQQAAQAEGTDHGDAS